MHFKPILNKGVPYMKTNNLGIEVGLQLINFVIPLRVTYAEDYQGVC